MSGLPKQKIPLSKKNEEWKRDTINYYERLSYTSATGNRTSNYNKLINYDLYNGKFNKADLEYVCNPLGLTDNEFPATLQNYDVVSPAMNLLIGEETKRPDNTLVISESPEDISRKNEALSEKIKGALQQEFMAMIDPSTVDPENPPQLPEEILKYEKYTTSDLIESQGNKILKSLKKRLNMKEVFKKGFKDALLAGEEIYWVGVSNNEPISRRCNPVNITVVLDGDSDFIDDAIAVVEVRMLAPNTIIDEFGDDLTSAQIDDLEALTRVVTSNYNQAGYNTPAFKLSEHGNVVDTGITSASTGFGATSGAFNQHLIRVVRIEWKSMKKMYELTYTDIETGMPITELVDETFNYKVFKEVYPDAKIEEFWISEAWEGVKIGPDMYVNVRPKANQRRRMDNPYPCKLGYVGLIYNATNSVSVSLMDRLKPYQYLYNIISYRLELAFASDMGKIMLMDLAQIPRSEGIDIEKWMYYLKAMKIGFINSFEEGRKGVATGKLSNFNQFQSIDLSLANVIQQYIQTLEYLKQQIAFISGVSPQRLGAINTNELVGNVERSVQQSALITEYLFDSHNEVKRRVYAALIEAAKVAYRDGLVTQYVLDDMSIEMLQIPELLFENTEFNVYVSNSSKDQSVVEQLKQLSQIALQSDKADLSTIIDTIINDSPRDIVRTLQRSEQAKYDRDAQAQQAQMESQQNIAAQQMQMEERKLAMEQYKIDTDSQTKIQVAEINVYSRQENLDQNANGIPDPLELAKQSLVERESMSNAFRDDLKLKMDKDKSDKEMSLKEQEISNKRKLEEMKIKAIQVQNTSQEKIAKQQNDLKEKELKAKLEIEKMKLRAARAKQNKTK
jgi:hypothetical protein